MSKSNVREIALQALLQIEKDQAYSNLLLNQMINKHKLNHKDVGLLTELVYGSVQRKKTLDYFLAPFVKKGLKKLDLWVLVLLRMSLYQLVYLDRIPDRAIVHEAVELAKKKGHKGISSMVNGTLRSIIREGVGSVDEIKDPIQRLAIKESYPTWLIERWVKQFGIEKTSKICEVNAVPPVVTARVNRSKISTIEEAISRLEAEGVKATKGDLSPDAIKIIEGHLPSTTLYKDGCFTIQDESSMLVARALAPAKGTNVLDSCAAPGGKTTHIAEIMVGTGSVHALDLHEHKIKLIKDQAKRLQLPNIHTNATDSRKANQLFEKESFDYILVDAPCTGFGVIRRKPDIKWQKSEQDINRIANIQIDILTAVAPLLKRGGRLVYSTCTIDVEENENVVQAFLKKHTDYQIDDSLAERLPACTENILNKGMLQLLPHDFDTDGFFIAALIKQ